jgi:hypothetical protein
MNTAKLTDKQRIDALEAENRELKIFVQQELSKIRSVIGITVDYVHTPVKLLTLN